MNSENILVRAKIQLLPADEGGRKAPITGSYRPNHNFFGLGDQRMTVGFVEVPEGTELYPGDSFEIRITFWGWAGLTSQIYPGREWRIQEGAKLVGFGTILEVLSSS